MTLHTWYLSYHYHVIDGCLQPSIVCYPSKRYHITNIRSCTDQSINQLVQIILVVYKFDVEVSRSPNVTLIPTPCVIIATLHDLCRSSSYLRELTCHDMFSYDFNLYWQHAVMHVDNFTWIFLKKSGTKNNSSYKQTCKEKKFNEGKKSN